MPPRRSTRPTRASLEPEHTETTNPTKRKRGQSVVDDEEQEQVAEKPPPRPRKPSSARASVGVRRASGKSNKSLDEVPETDEEQGGQEEDEPPVKKARSSPPDDEEEEESDAERAKPKGRRGSTVPKKAPAAAKKGTRKSVVKKEVVEEEEEDEDSDAVVPVSNGQSSAASGSGKAPTSRSTRNAKSKTAPLSSEEEDEEPKPAGKGRSKGRAATKNSDDDSGSDAHMQSDSDDDEPKAKGKGKGRRSSVQPSRGRGRGRGRGAATATGRASKPPVERIQESDEGSDNEPIPSPRKKSAAAAASKKGKAKITDTEEDEAVQQALQEEEDEKSLLDPPQVKPTPLAAQPSLLSRPITEEPTGPKSRLVIHKMALINFKSYAGKQIIGPFHKSFSSIVGPNGSGKSNTIDALLFVFGYRASKMRQGKLSELIHNSARYPDLDDCSVEVHFREIVDLPGPDAYEVVPNSRLVVARQAFKNNSSRYTINGRASNFTEVQTLLKARGIDLDHKRFLILQGEVESIAQMKPKAPSEHEDGLLEYLEDIIGTSVYKTPIEESFAEMERLAEERTEKLNRLRVVEKEKLALEKGKKEAEDWLRMGNELTRAKSRLWQWNIWKAFLNEDEFDKQITKVTNELEEEREKNKDDIEHLGLLEKHYKEREQAYKEVQEAAAEAKKDLAEREKVRINLTERHRNTKTKEKKLKKSLDEDKASKAAADRTIKDSGEKIIKQKRLLDEHEASLETEEKALEVISNSLKGKTQVFHDQIEAKQKELQPWTAQINAKQAEIDVATSERDALVKKANALKEAGKEAQAELEQLKADHASKSKELETLNRERDLLVKQKSKCEQDLQDKQKLLQGLKERAIAARQKVDEAKASQAQNTSHNQVLDSLTKLQESGRISGFHGRLGGLGAIEKKYDVAITTACGSLNNLVVDTVEQGQQCIEYLRSQNVGRASFMVLEKVSIDPNAMAPLQTPENVPRLFDLIRPKNASFRPAFYKAIGNTLVADNMEQANRIAFGAKRWRVVTLAGQLIDTSGTMSGGGGAPRGGGMSSKLASDTVSPATLKTYEKTSEEAAAAFEEAQAAVRELEAQLESHVKSIPQIHISIDKVKLDIHTATQRIHDAEKRVNSLKSQSKPDAGDLARIAALDKDIAKSTQKLGEVREQTSVIEEAIKALEQKILDIGGAQLLSQKSKVEGIRLHITLASDEITKAEVAKNKAEKDSKKFETAGAANTAAMEEVTAALDQLNAELEECTEYVEELKASVEKATHAAENSKDDLDALKTQLDEKTEQIREFRQKEAALIQTLNDVKKERENNSVWLDRWQTEHDNLKLEDIDDDEDEDEDEEGVEKDAPPTPAPDGAEPSVDEDIKPDPEKTAPPKRKRREPNELQVYTAEELAQFKKREMIADVELLDEKLKNMKPNLSILKEYRKREEDFLRRAKDLEAITGLRDAEKQKYDGLRKQRLDEFMTGFNLISLKLKEMYQMITLGGNAELELVDSMDPFSEGIIFSVMPPKKSWKNISNLSGGEKTLSSLALVFALHVFKPTPLYFMDEIDAALDFRNVSIVANYIKDRTKNAQFIIISLRNDMFELSHRLIGIYKTSNATQSISIDNHALHSKVPMSAAVA